MKSAATNKGASEKVIVFTVSGFRFAIAASAVSEIRNLDGLERFSAERSHRAVAKVDHTLQRSGVTFFVVNAARYFGLPPAKPGRVLVLQSMAVAILVDSTDRIMEISALRSLPQAFNGEERNWYRGLTIFNDEVLPVVNPSAFLTKGEFAVLRALKDMQQAQQPAAG